MFCKSLARDMFYWSADVTGRLRSRENSMTGSLTVLTYHRVLPDEEARACPFPSLAMPATWFRSQMGWLRQNARVLTLGRALDELENDPGGKPLIAVTFDDGYFDNFEIAAPVLRDTGLKATFFICTAPIRTRSHFWYDSIAEGALRWGPETLKKEIESPGAPDESLARADDAHSIVAVLKRRPDSSRRAAVEAVEKRLGSETWTYRSHVMTAEQVRELASEGHEIGSHTETHPILPSLEESEGAGELSRSKAWLEATIGQPVRGFCYPNGDHSPETRTWVTRAGYAYACLTEEGGHEPGSDPFLIRRIDVAPNRVGNCFQRWSERSFRAILSQLRRPPRVAHV